MKIRDFQAPFFAKARNRKSQMEIMGLAVIVILVALAILFTIRFVILQEPAEYKKGYTQQQLAINMVNTLLETTTASCSDLLFKELFKDCAETNIIICDNGMDSCSYIRESIDTIFMDTLETWDIDYEFNFVVGTNPPLISKGSCPDERIPGSFSIPGAIASTINLYIC